MSVASMQNPFPAPQQTFFWPSFYKDEDDERRKNETAFSGTNYIPNTDSPVITQMAQPPLLSKQQKALAIGSGIAVGLVGKYLATTMLTSVGLGAVAGGLISLSSSVKRNWSAEKGLAGTLKDTFTDKQTYTRLAVSAAFATVGVVGVEVAAEGLGGSVAHAHTETTGPSYSDSSLLGSDNAEAEASSSTATEETDSTEKLEVPCNATHSSSWTADKEAELSNPALSNTEYNQLAKDIYVVGGLDPFLTSGECPAEETTTVPIIEAPEAEPEPVTPAPEPETHAVAKGDNLWNITKEHYNLEGASNAEIQKYVDALAHSMDMAGTDANKLEVGQIITLPTVLEIQDTLTQDWASMDAETKANLAEMEVEAETAPEEQTTATAEEPQATEAPAAETPEPATDDTTPDATPATEETVPEEQTAATAGNHFPGDGHGDHGDFRVIPGYQDASINQLHPETGTEIPTTTADDLAHLQGGAETEINAEVTADTSALNPEIRTFFASAFDNLASVWDSIPWGTAPETTIDATITADTVESETTVTPPSANTSEFQNASTVGTEPADIVEELFSDFAQPTEANTVEIPLRYNAR